MNEIRLQSHTKAIDHIVGIQSTIEHILQMMRIRKHRMPTLMYQLHIMYYISDIDQLLWLSSCISWHQIIILATDVHKDLSFKTM